MNCPNCKTENSETNNFCSSCGKLLHQPPTREELVQAIRDVTGDRELVEKTIAIAVTDRVWSWFKIFGSIAGFLVLMAAFILGKQMSDIQSLVGTTKLLEKARAEAKDAEKEAGDALQKTVDARKSAEDVLRQSNELSEQLRSVPQFIELTKKLSNSVAILQERAAPRPSLYRPAVKYREPAASGLATPVTVEQLFQWTPVPGLTSEDLLPDSAVDKRENSVLRTTGDVYAAQVDGVTASLRVQLAAPGQAQSPAHVVVVVVPHPSLVKNGAPYQRARDALLKVLGKKEDELPSHGWLRVSSARITAVGYAQYNPSQPGSTASTKIGAWQISPAWEIVPAQ
jgi:hypothetical protein